MPEELGFLKYLKQAKVGRRACVPHVPLPIAAACPAPACMPLLELARMTCQPSLAAGVGSEPPALSRYLYLSLSLFPSLSLSRSLSHTHSHTHTPAQVPLNEYDFPQSKLASVQSQLERLVEKNYYLHTSARDAYRSYILAYNSHGLKDIFNVHTLDLQVRPRRRICVCPHGRAWRMHYITSHSRPEGMHAGACASARLAWPAGAP